MGDADLAYLDDEAAFEDDASPGPQDGASVLADGAGRERAPGGSVPGQRPTGRGSGARSVGGGDQRARVLRPPAPVIDLGRLREELAGPDELGRGLFVRPGAEVPTPWASVPRARLVLGGANDGGSEQIAQAGQVGLAQQAGLAQQVGQVELAEQVEQVASWWSARARFVVEIDPADDEVLARWRAAQGVELREPWVLGPDFEFAGERLAALLSANALDARDPAQVRWALADAAVARGAALLASVGGPEGDVVLASGEGAWLDGGPLAPQRLSLPVVAELAVSAGPLAPFGPGQPGAELAPDQLAAVGHTGGGARIIAPAGSGKTRVLTERARHLLGDWGVPASALCLVAFNVRAAEEMRTRTTDLSGLTIRTLNSLGLAIVNGSGPFLGRPDGRRLNTIDEPEVRRILERLVRFPRRAGTDPVAPWIEALSAVRLGLRDPVEVEASFSGDVDGFADVLPSYREELARRGLVDYDEQICGALERLLREPAARAAARAASRVLLVDEFQDLAPAHLLLVRLLSAPFYDCFGVGDDDQTIYGYAGANPDWLVRFSTWFPGAGSHALEVNYRCPPAVVAAASNLLTRNRRRVAKTISAKPARPAEPAALVVSLVDHPVSEAVERVTALIEGGAAPADVAVLTRVNATLLGVQLLLAERGVPTTAPVNANFLTRSGVRAALAWLTLATAEGRGGRLAGNLIGEAARRPPRSLSPRLLEWMSEQSSAEGLTRLATRLSNAKDADKVLAFVTELATLSALAARATTAEVLVAVRDRVGLGNAMDSLDRSRRDLDRSAHGDDLAALVAVAHLQPDPAAFGAWLRRQLERPTVDPNGVQLSTIHRVKGREWPYVIVHDASAGVIPHRLAADTEEERRVFHVAITRSSEATIVVAEAAAPSPFLAELAAPGEPPPVPPDSSPSGRSVRSAGTRPAAGGSVSGESGAAPELVAALKSWRLERARRDKVPPYVVLHDRNLETLAAQRPKSLVELSRCPGIGPTKLERYGDEILAVLSDG